jgi:hypothetical protein
MQSQEPSWLAAKEHAVLQNSWFTAEYVDIAVRNIVSGYLQQDAIKLWLEKYPQPTNKMTVGIVMAGNIPLVGFHDFLCGFVSGHRLRIKLSSKDIALMKAIVNQLIAWCPELASEILFEENLKGCDAYIATGSNNSSRYFAAYFEKWPSIIRSNRTSVAVLDGTETDEDLHLLANDVFTYFGLGCRNVTQLCVPEGYDFSKLLDVFRNYESMKMHHKYNNNYDYHLAIYLLNKVPYMTNDTVLLVENNLPFSAVSVLHYRYYSNLDVLLDELRNSSDVQAIVGKGGLPFGTAQIPSLTDYADGVDTMAFLCSL